MQHFRTYLVLALLAILGTFYVVNFSLTRGLISVLIQKPVKISFMILEPPLEECQGCFDGGSIVEMVEASHPVAYTSKTIPFDSALSQKFIGMYAIQNLPAVIVSGDISDTRIVSAWQALSGVEKDGRIVIENLLPFFDLNSRSAKGVIRAVIITDASCENCFDENEYLNMMERLGLAVGDTTVYDSATGNGAEFVQKYGITKLPAMILSPDAADYEGLASSWSEVGTVQDDGWFVFREVQKLNLEYKQL